LAVYRLAEFHLISDEVLRGDETTLPLLLRQQCARDPSFVEAVAPLARDLAKDLCEARLANTVADGERRLPAREEDRQRLGAPSQHVGALLDGGREVRVDVEA